MTSVGGNAANEAKSAATQYERANWQCVFSRFQKYKIGNFIAILDGFGKTTGAAHGTHGMRPLVAFSGLKM